MRGATIGPAHHGTMKVCPFLCPLSTEFHAIQYETAGLENPVGRICWSKSLGATAQKIASALRDSFEKDPHALTPLFRS